MRELLQELMARWDEQGAPIASRLLPGVDDRQLGEAEKVLGFPFSDELRTWYSWHNGFDRSAEQTSLWSLFVHPGSLEEAIDGYFMYRESARELTETADNGTVWNYGATWVPLTSPEMVILVADNSDPAAASPVHRLVVDGEPDAWRCWSLPSITSLVQGWLRLTVEGALRFDAEADWVVDRQAVPPELLICVQ